MSKNRPTLDDGREYAAARGYRVTGGYGPRVGQCIIDAVDFAEQPLLGGATGTGTAFAQDMPGHGVKPSAARIERIS